MPVSMIVEQTSRLMRCWYEVAHHALELALAHLAVRDRDPRLGHQLLEPLAHPLDRFHFVVQEVDLPAALQLAQHRLADDALPSAV